MWYELRAKTFSYTVMTLQFKFELIAKNIGPDNVMFEKLKDAEKVENPLQYNDDQ